MESATDAEKPKKKTEGVLFVDDERHILSSLKRLIKPLKLNVFTAESGKYAHARNGWRNVFN